MLMRTPLVILAGALVSATIAVADAARRDDRFTAPIAASAQEVIKDTGGEGISARFTDRFGWPTRHPLLIGGASHTEATRDRVAKAVAAVPGVGGVSWSDGTVMAEAQQASFSPLHCQDDVEGLLAARSIRFEEGSSAIMPSSNELLDEVAEALKPCLGSTIAIIGHTDSSGSEAANIALSRERASAVKRSLIARGIPAEGMKEKGMGAEQPVEGLQAGDPANRRIEFDVVAIVPVEPSPIDTPGPR